MSKHPERARDYLGHILTALERIQKYSTEKTAADFAEETLLQDRVLRNLGIIGERLLVCLQNHPILRPGIRRFRWPRSTPCAIGSRTRAKKWTWTSSGTFRSVSAVHYTLAGGPGGRCRCCTRERECRGRKVRTPQGSVPDNVRDAGFKARGRPVPQRRYRLGYPS